MEDAHVVGEREKESAATRTCSTDAHSVTVCAHVINVTSTTYRHLRLTPAVGGVEALATGAEAAVAQGVGVGANIGGDARREESDETNTETRFEEEATLAGTDAVTADGMRVHTTAAISTRTLDEAARETAVFKHEVVVQTATLSSITTRVDVSAYVITRATGSKAERRVSSKSTIDYECKD